MKRLAGIVVLLLSGAGAGASPGGPPPGREVRLSLREAVFLALDRNLDIEVARYQPWIEDRGLRTAAGAFDHVFYAEASHGRSRLEPTSALSGATTLDTEDGLLKTGLRRTLSNGATYDVAASAVRSETNSTFALLNPFWTEQLELSVRVPFLKGAGEAANATPILLARNARRVAVAQFEKMLTDTVYAVHESYWTLVAMIEVKRFREQALETAQRLLEDNRRRFERGMLAKVDVTQAESGVASQVEGILTAEKSVQDAMDRLKRLVDPALLREETTIVPLDAPRRAEPEFDERRAIEEGMQEALTARPEYRQLAVQLDSQRLRLEKADTDRRPRLDAVASGRLTGTDDAFGPAAGDLREAGTYGWSLGLSLEIPLEGRAAEGAWQQAELERRRLVLQRRAMEDQLLVEIREAAREIKTVEKRIEATRKARALAQEQFDGEMNRRDQGLRTTFHVLDAQARLSEARTNEVRALTDRALAVARYDRASGALLRRHGILLEPNLPPRQTPR